MQIARQEIGITEYPGDRDNPDVVKYLSGSNEAIFVDSILDKSDL